MNVRSKLVAIAGSALILASSLTVNAAETKVVSEDGTASVAITKDATKNIFAVEVSDGTFKAVDYSFTSQDTTGTLDVTVTDLRGNASGWTINLSATDFTTRGENAQTFGIGNLKLTPGQVEAETKFSDAAKITASGEFQVSGAGHAILIAPEGAGDGKFKSVLAGDLNVPGGTLVGNYTSKVTVSAEVGP